MKNWAQNKKNPVNRIRTKESDNKEYGDFATIIGFVSAVSAMKRSARNKDKGREECAK
jgi:hypothetical protein